MPNLPALGMSNSYHGEPYIPADIFNVSLCLHLFGPTLWESHSPKFKDGSKGLVGTCSLKPGASSVVL